MLLDAHTAEQLDPAAPLAMLLDHFDLIVQTPADVDKLDAAILQLAVEGKLVAQDPGDEPAIDLLKRTLKIKGESSAQVLDQLLNTADADQVLSELPPGWINCRFGDITINRDSERIPLSRTQREGVAKVYDYYGASGVIDKVDGYLFEKSLLLIGEDGANLILRSKPIAFIATGKYWVNNHAHVIDAIDFDLLRYLAVFINAIDLKPYVTGTAQPKMNQSKMNSIPIALPPLAEQKRIVARVDELRRHTAALRAELAAAAQDAVTVNNAALNRLHTAADADAFAAAWQTLSDAFDPLYSVPQNLTALRQTILQLAVQGKLVPQDPNDEPATELIKRIEVEKERLYDEKRLPLLKKPPKVHPDDIPFGIPDGWIWVRSSDVCLSINDGDHLPPPKTESGVPFLVISNIRTGQLDFSNTRFVSHDYYKNLNPSRKPQIGDILYSIVGSLGIPVLMETDLIFCFQRHIALFRPGTEVNSKYMYYLLMSPFVFQQSRDYATGIAQLTIPLSGLRKLLFPIPPLAEQERIVAKVDELLALCDLLEGELIEAEAVRARVVDAVLAGV